MKHRLIISLCCCLLAAAAVMAQDVVDTRPHIFDSNVRSLKVCLQNNMYIPAVYMMGSDDRLLVEFDYLGYEPHYLRYSITHCNADWQPSQLVESEYVSGFNYADIDDFAPSEATYVHYYNYQFELPNENMEFLVSGNYLLSVYEQDDPDEVLFQTRISVCEGRVGVYPKVTSRTDVDYNNRFQQVSFDVRYRPNQIRDPYSELICVVTQNSRDDNAVIVTRPMMVAMDHVTYDHNRMTLYTELSKLGFRCVKPQGAFYMMVEAPDGNSEGFSDRAKALNILAVPCDGFGCPGFVRFSTCVSPSMIQRSLPAFRKLADSYGLEAN